MKHLWKRAAVLLMVLALALSLTACADTSWAVRSGSDTVSAALYQSYLFDSFNTVATNYYNQGKDSTKMFDDMAGDQTMEEYLESYAIRSAEESILFKNWVSELGLTVDPSEKEAAEKDAESFYADNESYMTKIGLDKDGFYDFYRDRSNFYTVFNYFYGEEGQTPITLEMLTEQFVDTCYRVHLLGVPLLDYEAGALMSEEKQQEVKDRLAEDAVLIGVGSKTLDEVCAEEQELDSSVEIMVSFVPKDGGGYPEDMMNELSILQEGLASVFTYDNTAYLFQLLPINDTETQQYIEDYAFSMRYNLVSEDFNAKVEEKYAAMTFDINDSVINKYSAKDFAIES